MGFDEACERCVGPSELTLRHALTDVELRRKVATGAHVSVAIADTDAGTRLARPEGGRASA